VTPPGTSSATVTTAGVAPGSSTLTFTGTSAPGGIVHTATAALTVYTAAPAAPSPTAPANNATNVALRPTYTWAALPQGAEYALEVSLDAAFTPPLLYTALVTGTSHVATADLPSNTRVYWRLRSSNACGTGPDSAVSSFTTVPLPGDCPVDTVSQVSLIEDAESGDGLWTHSGTLDSWGRTTLRAYTGSSSWRANPPTTVSDQRLVSPPIQIPSGLAPVNFVFWDYQSMEDRTGGCYDGALLEISTDNGTTWTQLQNPVLPLNPYDGPLASGNPAAPAPAWCGDPQDWTRNIVSMDAFAGQTVRFRFRVTSDGSVDRPNGGWFVDDMRIQGCNDGSGAAPDPLFKNGFE
jgi:hypothetical protein